MHLFIGEEAVAVGVHEALTADGAVVSTYREHGHALARGVPAEAIMAEMFGKVTGCQTRPCRLDAPLRRRPPLLRRQRPLLVAWRRPPSRKKLEGAADESGRMHEPRVACRPGARRVSPSRIPRS
jgi:hypothetical protein